MEDPNSTTIKYVPTESNKKNTQFVPEDEFLSETWYLWFSVLTGLLLFISGGATSVWFSPALVKLKSNNTDVNPMGRPITTFETSQFLGIVGLAALIGPVVFPKVADIIGRKKVLLLNGLIMFLSIMGLACANSVKLIIIFGTCVNIVFTAVLSIMPMYLTEICENHNRAKFGCLMTACVPAGQLYTFSVGAMFSYRRFTLLTAMPLVPFVILFWFAPETPVYYLTKEKVNDCEMTLKKLRGNKSDKQLENDFNSIRESIQTSKKNNQNNLVKLFKLKEGRTGLMLGVFPILVQFFSGVPIVMSMLAPIFNESGSSLSGHTISIMVGVVKVTLFMVPFVIVERTGRKPLLIISAIGAGLAVAGLGFYFYLRNNKSPLVPELHWVPPVFAILYIGLYGLGLGPIPMSIVGKLFFSDLRSTATALTTIFTNGFLALYTSSFPYLIELIGTHWCMWIFSGTCFLGALLIYLILPETKGKSVLEIQKILKDY